MSSDSSGPSSGGPGAAGWETITGTTGAYKLLIQTTISMFSGRLADAELRRG